MSDTPDQTKKQALRKRQARAMTRAIDRVSDEFIEAFSQSGLDDGPEKPKKAEPVRQALIDREERENREQADGNARAADAPMFKGLGALLAASPKKATGNFARVFEPEPEIESDATVEGQKEASPASPSQTADGAIIKVRDTVGKKRGLYTSCMQRPDEAQLKAWAKMAEIEEAEAEKIKAEKAKPDHALAQKSEPENKKVVQMPQRNQPERAPATPMSAESRSVLHKLASTSHTPSRQPLITPSAHSSFDLPDQAPTHESVKNQKTCAIRGGCAKLGGFFQRLVCWLKGLA